MTRLQRDLRFAPTGFVGYWILKKDAPHFIQHRAGFAFGYAVARQTSIRNPASSIEYLTLYGSNVNANDIFISDSGLSGLGSMF